jgi:type IV secretion system protein VirB9
MLKKIGISIFAITSLTHAALADAPPPGDPDAPDSVQVSNSDPRILRLKYEEGEIYNLDVSLRSVTVIRFGPGENVQSIMIGDSSSWQVVKLKAGNVVSVKPISPSATNNMTIYTNRRVYSFSMTAKDDFGEQKPPTPYRIEFIYPEKPDTGLAQGGPIDQNYLVSGRAPFRPLSVQDNEIQTTFYMPPNSPRPAIFKVGPDRDELLVNSRTDGDRVIVDGRSDFWVLRIGDQSVCIGHARAIRASSHKHLSFLKKMGFHHAS